VLTITVIKGMWEPAHMKLETLPTRPVLQRISCKKYLINGEKKKIYIYCIFIHLLYLAAMYIITLTPLCARMYV